MAYGIFADHYDALTSNVDYKSKADYICEIFARLSHSPETALDLACGTGSLTLELHKKGIDIFGVDASAEMLTQAQNKSLECGEDILFVRQRMESLQLWGSIDTCVCTLDSLSHLQGIHQLEKTMERVSYYMEKNGVFVFDVNTPFKHKHILGGNTFIYDTDSVYLVWQNTFRESDCSVKIELDFFIPENGIYTRESESFREYAYPADTIIDLLNKYGFSVEAMYDDFSFEPPNDTSQRITFAARKI
ncbi:MAG: class I SAM-dependent methyltransferase [Clostridia bacterium]|nr:class I SAM-dependent methyltransferase [Clostridia bacterium]